jgi:DHA3 family macrolide efflux protein-like MFS transporter
VLIGGILLGLIAGLLAGGSITNLAHVRLRWVGVLFLAVLVRFATETALGAQIGIVEVFRLGLFGLAFGMLLVGLWVNRSHPGMSLAFIGILSNAIAVVVNGGYMPIWEPSLRAAGFPEGQLLSPFHTILPDTGLSAGFLLHAGPLADILPIPLPLIQNVASIGDLFLSAGLGFFLFATVLRSPEEAAEESAQQAEADAAWEAATDREQVVGMAGAALLRRRVKATDLGRRVLPETGLASGFADVATLDRPVVLGGPGAGLSSPGATSGRVGLAALLPAGVEDVAIPTPRPIPDVVLRVRRHPYVRLALNPSFSALWVGQLISLFGDRVHQIAIVFLVLAVTNSPIAVAMVFVAATLPNLFLSPLAGTYVDRWDQKDVMVVSDLLRATLILIIPIAAVTNVLFVYPLVFIITSVSIFFRPARVAALPRIVREDELLTANSAMWIAETIADVIGYPLAAIFVGFLGASLPLAFWIDAATYAASAVLIASIVVPPIVRKDLASAKPPTVVADMKAGWRFLRGETTLLANTLQATVAQLTVGVLLTVTPIYAAGLAIGQPFNKETAYGFLEAGIGVGNLLGGFVIGVIGARIAKGKTIIAGYAVWGAWVAGLAITGNLGAAIGLMFGSGIANMVFVIPSQTLFQERTPADMLGRVIGFRFALVFGSMTIAMGLGGILAAAFGAAPVIGVFGFVTMAAGLAGLFVPAVRNA